MIKAREQKTDAALSFLNSEFIGQIHLLSGSQVSEDQIKMLFLGMLSKVKLFIERDTQRSLRDIEESKHQFKVKLDALEAQKRKEKLMFSRAINTLRKLYQAESSSLKNDHGKIIERLQEQI